MNYVSRADIESFLGPVIDAPLEHFDTVLASMPISVRIAFDREALYAAPAIPEGMREQIIRDAIARAWSSRHR